MSRGFVMGESSGNRRGRQGNGMEYGEWQVKLRVIWGVIWQTNVVETSYNIYMYEGNLKWNQEVMKNTVPNDYLSLVTKWNFQFQVWVISKIELLAKEFLWEPLNNPDCCQDYRLLSTNWWQGTTAEDHTYTNHWTWGKWAATYIASFLHVLVSLLLEVLSRLPKEKHKH